MLRQVVIIRRGMGFSPCLFYLLFLFSLFSPSPSPACYAALRDGLPLHLGWGEGNEGTPCWSLSTPWAGETADAGETGRTGKAGRE